TETQKETIAHVLCGCPFGALRRNERHHKVRSRLAELLRKKGFRCYEEVACRDDLGRNRRADIVVLDPKSDKGYIIDPTVRFETNREMDEEVQREKSAIYNACFTDLSSMYAH